MGTPRGTVGRLDRRPVLLSPPTVLVGGRNGVDSSMKTIEIQVHTGSLRGLWDLTRRRESVALLDPSPDSNRRTVRLIFVPA
jgi:hypothetical protein